MRSCVRNNTTGALKGQFAAKAIRDCNGPKLCRVGVFSGRVNDRSFSLDPSANLRRSCVGAVCSGITKGVFSRAL